MAPLKSSAPSSLKFVLASVRKLHRHGRRRLSRLQLAFMAIGIVAQLCLRMPLVCSQKLPRHGRRRLSRLQLTKSYRHKEVDAKVARAKVEGFTWWSAAWSRHLRLAGGLWGPGCGHDTCVVAGWNAGGASGPTGPRVRIEHSPLAPALCCAASRARASVAMRIEQLHPSPAPCFAKKYRAPCISHLR